MIRIWGLLKPGCLPTFTAMSDNQDSMQLLFRLLTKLWLCCKTRRRNTTPSASPGAACHFICMNTHEGQVVRSGPWGNTKLQWCYESFYKNQMLGFIDGHLTLSPASCPLIGSAGRRPPPGTRRKPDRRVLPAAQSAAGSQYGLAPSERRHHREAAREAAAAAAVRESLVAAGCGRLRPPGYVHQVNLTWPIAAQDSGCR